MFCQPGAELAFFFARFFFLFLCLCSLQCFCSRLLPGHAVWCVVCLWVWYCESFASRLRKELEEFGVAKRALDGVEELEAKRRFYVDPESNLRCRKGQSAWTFPFFFDGGKVGRYEFGCEKTAGD